MTRYHHSQLHHSDTFIIHCICSGDSYMHFVLPSKRVFFFLSEFTNANTGKQFLWKMVDGIFRASVAV